MSLKRFGRTGSKLFASCLLVGGVAGIAVGSVDAATIPNPVLNITVTPTNPQLSDNVRTDVQWCVPDSTTAGDDFTIALAPELTGLPSGFNLLDPNGALVATASIAGAPAVATFTFTDYVDTHDNVCGTAFFESRLDSSLVPGNTYTLRYVVNGSATFEPQITIQPGGTVGGRNTAHKGSTITDPSDQCRTVTTGCIGWFVETRLGPLKSVTVTDNGLQNASFECSTISVRLWSVDASGKLQTSFSAAAAGVTTTCTPAGFEVNATNIPADRLLRVLIRATPNQPAPNGGVTFRNTAIVTQVSSTNTVNQDNVAAQRRTATAGGDGNGVVPTPTTTVDTTPASTTTTIANAVLPPAPPAPAAPFTPPPNAQLPATGSHGALLWAGLVMVLAGMGLMLVSVRRREAASNVN